MVLRGELDVELVGDEAAVAGQDLRGVVDLALQGGRDLHRLHGTAESLREGAGDHLLETVLEPLEHPHAGLPPSQCLVAVCAVLPAGRGGTRPIRGPRMTQNTGGVSGVLASYRARPYGHPAGLGGVVRVGYPERASRASGGIGRRARFRSVCPKGRGGSTPPSRTTEEPRVETWGHGCSGCYFGWSSLSRPREPRQGVVEPVETTCMPGDLDKLDHPVAARSTGSGSITR